MTSKEMQEALETINNALEGISHELEAFNNTVDRMIDLSQINSLVTINCYRKQLGLKEIKWYNRVVLITKGLIKAFFSFKSLTKLIKNPLEQIKRLEIREALTELDNKNAQHAIPLKDTQAIKRELLGFIQRERG